MEAICKVVPLVSSFVPVHAVLTVFTLQHMVPDFNCWLQIF